MKNLVLFRRIFITLWFIATLLDVSSVVAQQICNPLCAHPHVCQTDSGKCLCHVGWTGPNAFYINDQNTVLADYCTQPCVYNGDFKNTDCAAEPPPTTTTTTTTTTTMSTTTTLPTTTEVPTTNSTTPRTNTTIPSTNATMSTRNSTVTERNSTRPGTSTVMPATNATITTNFTRLVMNSTTPRTNTTIPPLPVLVNILDEAIKLLEYLKNIFKIFG